MNLKNKRSIYIRLWVCKTKGRRVSTGRARREVTCFVSVEMATAVVRLDSSWTWVTMENIWMRHLCIFKKSVFDLTLRYGLIGPHPDVSRHIRTNQDTFEPSGNHGPEYQVNVMKPCKIVARCS